jgi:putative ABC transport system permease protein
MNRLFFIVLTSYFIILFVAYFNFRFKVKVWRELLVSSVLSLLQLFLIALVIMYLLKLKTPLVNLLFVLVFFFNASVISYRRLRPVPYPFWKVFGVIFLLISLCSSFILFLFYLVGVLKLSANSIIPLAGIITAAGMRSLSLSFRYFKSKVRDLEDVILGMFALGALDREVFKFIFRELLDDITVPMRDMFKSAGIVHIPGVMVGLLLSGIFPLKAAVVQFSVLSAMVFQFSIVPALALFSLVSLFGLKIYPGELK